MGKEMQHQAVCRFQQAEDRLRYDEEFRAEFQKLMHYYHSAMKTAYTQLEVLDDEFRSGNGHPPIHHMESRIKKPKSLFEKMEKKGYSIDLNHVQRITDVAGIRVVCHYTHDIYYLYDLIKRSGPFKIIRERDYIAEPKPNGYRSLHLVVLVQVFASDGILGMPVEIQLRSIAMDLWASLEHELRYKSKRELFPEDEQRLLECAERLARIDREMQELFLDDHSALPQKKDPVECE